MNQSIEQALGCYETLTRHTRGTASADGLAKPLAAAPP